MNWLEEQQELTRKIEALHLPSDEWESWAWGMYHWTGVDLAVSIIQQGNAPDFIKAIDRYVMRLSAEERATQKQLFIDYKEARQFIRDFENWLTDQLISPDTITSFVSGNPMGFMAAQLTDKVPSEMRKRLAWAQSIIEQWEEKVSKLKASLSMHIFSDVEGNKIHTNFEFTDSTIVLTHNKSIEWQSS